MKIHCNPPICTKIKRGYVEEQDKGWKFCNIDKNFENIPM